MAPMGIFMPGIFMSDPDDAAGEFRAAAGAPGQPTPAVTLGIAMSLPEPDTFRKSPPLNGFPAEAVGFAGLSLVGVAMLGNWAHPVIRSAPTTVGNHKFVMPLISNA